MRIHTDYRNLNADAIKNALAEEIKAGRIAPQVYFKNLTSQRSASHAQAYEVQLSAEYKVEGDGRRQGNSGSYGAGTEYAPTYDEWGWLLAALYEIDPDMVVGRVSNPTYGNREDFDEKTGMSYSPQALLRVMQSWADYNASHADEPHMKDADGVLDPFPYVTGKNTLGRRGFGRNSGEYLIPYLMEQAHEGTGPYKFQPRTPETVRAFARI